MKGNKINVTIRIDKDLWELAKIVLPCSRNAFIERQLTNYVNSFDEIGELEKEIQEMKDELHTKEEKLDNMIKVREMNNKNKDKIKNAMTTILDITYENDEVSQKQVSFIAERENISEDVLMNEIRKRNIKISKYSKEEREVNINQVKFK